MPIRVFPGSDWERCSPSDAGMSPSKLDEAKGWLDDQMADKPYRVVIVRSGRIVAEWIEGVGSEEKLPIASAAKSVYSNILGIVVAEGKIPSADAEAYDYFPELMDVPEEAGPKANRYSFPKDRHVTLRQLISNTSGYMKPGEEPGKVFNYQTYGMNILTHSLAAAYGLYDVSDPERSPGFKVLIEKKLASKIGVKWDYTLSNFDLHERARIDIYGYYCQIHTTAPDFARLGWLWCNWGRWSDEQIIPEDWLRESTRTNPSIMANCPEHERLYGYGIWTNDHGLLWPELPRSGFTASGAGGHYCSVFPEQDLVVVQNPGRYRRDAAGDPERGSQPLLRIILDSIA